MNARHTLLKSMTVAAIATATTLCAPALASAHEAASGPRPGTGTPAFQQCQGVTVDKSAPVIARAAVLIKAPVRKVWDLHTGIDAWDTWIPEITPAKKKTPGPLRPGSVFEWSPQGMQVTSTVTKADRNRCVAWAAPVNGIDGVHLWTFKKVRGGVLVTTEESWAGASVEADIPGNQAALESGLVDWVNRLKDTAETNTDCGAPVLSRSR
ncbi:SRPBCC family protein [Streptomyces sp. AC512_CC834]|uniref:SRPBCC family protein n=1 Tax=Streptomyces sp. AC512_CC834 TaxID=2823691 RepID=UPI001C2798E0|nr:SRPBCC family protein [Streptomyces sp. AC512_CC834]